MLVDTHSLIGDGVGDNMFADKYLALTAHVSQSLANPTMTSFMKISFILTKEMPAVGLLPKFVLMYISTLLSIGLPSLVSPWMWNVTLLMAVV